ncbi:MAG: DNA polymerase Y family protein [Paracoccaceae bacterium]
MRRFLSVWCPDWPLDRLRRERRAARTGTPDPSPKRGERPRAPFALTEAGADGIRIAAANPPARADGIDAGLALAEARARLPDLGTEEIDRSADAAALRGLAGWMIRWSPLAAVDGTDGVMLETTGCAHLWGGESAMMAAISAALDGAGICHRLGLAATPGAAWALAHAADGPLTRIAEGTPRALEAGLADLPVAGLRLGREASTLLRRFGLVRIGQLYGLDRRALARRFQSAETADRVVLRLDQALGRRAEPLDVLRPRPDFARRLACPEPLLDLEGLRTGLTRLLDALCGDLCEAGLGARRLRLAAFRSDGGVSEAEIATARPSRDPTHLARLFAERLEGIDPGFGVDLLLLEAPRAEPIATAPRPLARNLAADPVDLDALAALADRITARLGPGAVTVAAPVESHIPERAVAERGFEGRLPDWPTALPAGPRPLRMLAAPEAVEVVAEIPDGPPAQFVWRRLVRRVVRADGPERIAPEWWRVEESLPRARDYYRVEDADGRRYWLYREGLYGDGRGGAPRWFLHGLFA